MKFEMFFTPSSTCVFTFLKHEFTALTLPEHLCSSNTESPQQAKIVHFKLVKTQVT